MALAEGADIHGDEDYALRWAAYFGHVETVRVLLAAGADVHARNDEALRNARRLAAKFGNDGNGGERFLAMVALLEDHSVRRGTARLAGQSPALHPG
jgi:hypothetical protein